MINVQEVGLKVLAEPQLINNTTLNSATLDIVQQAANASKLRINLFLGTTDVAFTTLKLQSSDTNSGSDWVDVDGSVYGTDLDINGNASTLPGATDDNKIFGWTVNANGGAPRYYRVVATVGNSTGANICIVAEYGHRSNNLLAQDITTGFAELLCVPPVIPSTH